MHLSVATEPNGTDRLKKTNTILPEAPTRPRRRHVCRPVTPIVVPSTRSTPFLLTPFPRFANAETQTDADATRTVGTMTSTIDGGSTTVPTRIDASASRVVAICRRIDAETRLVSNARAHTGGSVVRLRTASGHSLHTLSEHVASELLLCTVDAAESYLDGNVELVVTVGTRRNQRSVARKLVLQHGFARGLSACVWCFVLLGIGLWIAPALPSPRGEL